MYVTTFKDTLARCVNTYFLRLGTLVSPPVLSLLFVCHAVFRSLSYASMPQEVYSDFLFLPLPPPLSVENLHLLHFFAYAEIIFAHILVSRECYRGAA